MSIRRILHKPHPFIFNRYSVLLPAILTFMVLFLLRPFDFDKFPMNHLIGWCAVFSTIVGITVFLSGLILKRCLRKTIKENWLIKNEILTYFFVITMISMEFFALFWIINPSADKFDLFLLVVLRTLAISFFPVLILVLYEQNHHQKIKRRQAELLNLELQNGQSGLLQEKLSPLSPAKIMLIGENRKAALHIEPADLYFIRSEGNYVEVFYQQNQKVHKELVRNSLKAMEDQLSSADFYRCHNRFLVNLRHIQKVVGNARNLDLVLEGTDEKVPVSRSKSETLLQLFQQYA